MTVSNALANGFSDRSASHQLQYTHLYYMYATAVNLHTMSATMSILLLKMARQEDGGGSVYLDANSFSVPNFSYPVLTA